jgi:hypothetical protein
MRSLIHPRVRLTPVSLSLCLVVAGCARWGGREVAAPAQEVGRRGLGAPQVAVTSESQVQAGFGAVSQTDGAGTSATVAGLAGSSGTVTRTHCIQQVEIDYTQAVEVHPEVEGRAFDFAGGVSLGAIGLGVMGVARMRSKDSVFEKGDPFYEEPPDPTAGYLVGGALIAGGIAWMLYSHSALPSEPRPAVQHARRAWTETRYVEATGCGLVPADRAAIGR